MNLKTIKNVIHLITASSLWLGCVAYAEEAPPPPLVAETWACTYKEGKDWDDKAKARDNLVNQVDKAGLTRVQAFHWTQMKGMAPVDTVWFDVHQNLQAFAAASDAWDASGIGAGVQAQFDKVEDCTAGLSTIQPFFVREGDEGSQDGDTTLIANLACTFKHGKGFRHLTDLTGHMNAVMQSFGDNGPGIAAVRRPVTSGPNFPDLFIFSIFENMTHWSNYVGQLFSTEQGQSMRNHRIC